MALSFAYSQESFKVAHASISSVDRFFFIENKGQWPGDVLYLCRLGGLDAWITRYGVNYTFYKIERMEAGTHERLFYENCDREDVDNSSLRGHRVLLELVGNNPNPRREGLYKQEGCYNYFIGNDPSKHTTDVGLYKEVIVKDVYPGIDLRYYFDRGFLRFDFVVHAGADPGQIQFRLSGQHQAYVKDNRLTYTTCFGEVVMAELRAYQQDTEVPAFIAMHSGLWHLILGAWTRSRTLVIDPLVYSTFIGGGSIEQSSAIAVDASGHAYVTGTTWSTNYDVTPGAFQITFGGGNTDVFVTKLNASGTALIYSTFLGGSKYDSGSDIVVDGSGRAYVTGSTNSTNYVVTPGVFQKKLAGHHDVFVTKLNASGNALLYSTYIGGSGVDEGEAIAIDAKGQAYVTGFTNSIYYDVTPGAFQMFVAGGYDAFVTKLDSSGITLVYSTYIGGLDTDFGCDIKVDASGQAYVTGLTGSCDFNVTAGAYQTTHGGGLDAFVTKLNANGTGLMYSTYLGGNGEETGYSIAVDIYENAYVTGFTTSENYDITLTSFQIINNGQSDVFVTKLNANGNALVYSTYIGGSDEDYGYEIVLDASGQAFVAGCTNSSDYDVTPGAFQVTQGGGTYDAFVTKLNASGTILIYSTFLGGSDHDFAFSVTIDVFGKVYVSGSTASTDYYVSPGAAQTTYQDSTDVFVTKLDLSDFSSLESSFAAGGEIEFYPNPTTDRLMIRTRHPGGTLKIHNAEGKILEVCSLRTEQESLDLSRYPGGIYLLCYETRDGTTVTDKLIKLK